MTSYTVVPFGKVLRKHRLAAGLSQEELAERSGLSARGIRALERGDRSVPHPQTLRLLADGLGLNDAERAEFNAAARPEIAEHHPPPSPSPQLPSRPLHATALRLPIAPNRLVGREEEAARVQALLGQPGVRLVSLTGPGGVGKTRLALDVAADVGHQLPDGAVFVDLASVQSAELVPAAIARALKVAGHGGQPLDEALATFLASRSLLLVLDNCEHVLEALVVAADLLAASPGLKVLATSRERLHLRGEREIPLTPLAIPAPVTTRRAEPERLASLMESPAVRLFMERATEDRPGFVLGDEDVPIVAEICRRLDGLPLALELAAARLRYLTPAELLARLERRLPVLTDGPRDLPIRQQTVRDTILWSYQMLPLNGQELFRRLAIFAGGWSIEAAHAITREMDTEPPELSQVATEELDGLRTTTLTEALELLADKSLIRLFPDREYGLRFGMLETIREFGTDALMDAGEATAIRARHAAYFHMLVQRADEMLKTADSERWLGLLDVEYDNIHAALWWAAEQPDPDLALRFTRHMGHYWYLRSYFSEARLWLRRALERGDMASPGLRADALYSASMMARAQSDFSSALRLGEEALSLSRELGDSLRTLQALYILGATAHFVGNHELAVERLEEGLALARERNEVGRIAAFLNVLADVARAQGDDERAWALSAEGLEIKREIGDAEGAAWCLSSLGGIALDRNDLGGAQERFDEALHLFRRLGNPAGIASTLCNLGGIAVRLADGPRGHPLLSESLAMFADLDDPGGIACVLEEFARLCLLDGRAERAASLLGTAASVRERTGEAPLPSTQAQLNQTERTVRAELDLHNFAAAWLKGRETPVQQIVAEILSGG